VLEEWLGMASTDAEVLRAVGAIYQVPDKAP